MIESQNSLYPREGQNGCGSKEACVSGLYRSPRVFHPQQKFGAAKFSLQSQSKQDIESHASDPHTNHVCNTYMSEQSSPRDVFQTYPARKSDSIKISPVKNYFNYFKPFSDVSTELQLLTIQMIPSSNCSNTKPSGEKLQVASVLWQPLNSVVFFFNEENIWAKTTSGDCKNTTPAMGILQSTRAFQCDSNPMVFSQVIKQRSSCFNLT